MIKYSFCEKDGKLKSDYINICEDILDSAEITHHVVTVGRHDDIIEEYDSYSFKVTFSSKSLRNDYEDKMKEITNYFGEMKHIWHSYNDIEFDFCGVDFETMRIELYKLLKLTEEVEYC